MLEWYMYPSLVELPLSTPGSELAIFGSPPYAPLLCIPNHNKVSVRPKGQHICQQSRLSIDLRYFHLPTLPRSSFRTLLTGSDWCV